MKIPVTDDEPASGNMGKILSLGAGELLGKPSVLGGESTAALELVGFVEERGDVAARAELDVRDPRC